MTIAYQSLGDSDPRLLYGGGAGDGQCVAHHLTIPSDVHVNHPRSSPSGHHSSIGSWTSSKWPVLMCMELMMNLLYGPRYPIVILLRMECMAERTTRPSLASVRFSSDMGPPYFTRRLSMHSMMSDSGRFQSSSGLLCDELGRVVDDFGVFFLTTSLATGFLMMLVFVVDDLGFAFVLSCGCSDEGARDTTVNERFAMFDCRKEEE